MIQIVVGLGAALFLSVSLNVIFGRELGRADRKLAQLQRANTQILERARFDA